MTQGNIAKALIQFVLPLALGNAFQQLYNIVDTLVLGHYVGTNALAAVGEASMIIWVFNAVIFGLKSGVSILCSTYYGAGNVKNLRRIILIGIWMLVGISAVCTIVGFLIGTPFLKYLNTPEEIFSDAILYWRIYVAGMSFLFVFNFCNGVFQSFGESRLPFLILVISSLVNIALDIVFVCRFKWAVFGVGLATVIAEFISALIGVVFLIRKLKTLHTDQKEKIWDFGEFKAIIRLALPSALQQGVLAIGVVAVQAVVNKCGTSLIAGATISGKIEGIVSIPLVTIGEAMSVFTAQNIGAKKKERIPQGIRAAFAISYILWAVIAVVSVFWGKDLVCLFLSEYDAAVVRDGYSFMMSSLCMMVFMVVQRDLSGVLCGMQKMKYFVYTFMINITARIIFAYSTYGLIGRYSVLIANPFSVACGMIAATAFYFRIAKEQEINIREAKE
jgi:putative MATE family efflux protein